MATRNILITGGMGGIGKSCVQKFLNQGDYVVFTYAEEKSNKILAEEFAQSAGKRANAIPIDMADPTSIQSAIMRSLSIMGSVDTLVNAAAVGSATVNSYAIDKDLQDSKMLGINAFGALKISESFIEINKGSTSIKKLINFSSVGGGLQAFPHFRLSDGMSKAAVSFLTKQLAAEHVHTNIDVFAIAPGATNTGMFHESTLKSMSEVEKKNFINKLPKQRLIEPDEIAALVIFLADEGSTYMHGAIIDASMGLGSRPGLISEL